MEDSLRNAIVCYYIDALYDIKELKGILILVRDLNKEALVSICEDLDIKIGE